jgi:hypothetical protein
MFAAAPYDHTPCRLQPLSGQFEGGGSLGEGTGGKPAQEEEGARKAQGAWTRTEQDACPCYLLLPRYTCEREQCERGEEGGRERRTGIQERQAGRGYIDGESVSVSLVASC